jgi:hypothetical protein
MAYEQRDNSGTRFKNDRKEKPNHPDYKGSAMIDGVEYWVSSWTKTGKNGVEYLSDAYTKKEQTAHHEAKANGYAPKKQDHDFNDDIGF